MDLRLEPNEFAKNLYVYRRRRYRADFPAGTTREPIFQHRPEFLRIPLSNFPTSVRSLND